jgi:DinB superfamily
MFMNREAQVVWASLEFRKPAMLQIVEAIAAEQMQWVPSNGRNSMAWLLWHIAEVEDNWIRDLWLGEPRRYPFGRSVRDARREHYPAKAELLAYFHEIRDLTKKRLEATTEADFDKMVYDAHFGPLSMRDVWGGVITSFAWHAGQIALTNRLLS